MISGRFQKYAPESHYPGEEALSYVKSSRKGKILAFTALVHGVLLLLPLLFMAVKERFKKPPRYVMHIPVVESVPGERSPYPSRHRKKAEGIPAKGVPTPDLPPLPEIVKLVPERKAPVTVPEKPVRKTPIVKQETRKQKSETKRSAIKISTKRVRRRTSQVQKQPRSTATEYAAQRQRQAAEARRRADLAQKLRDLGGRVGSHGVSGGGSGPSGVASPEVMRYYTVVDNYLRRRWNQPRGLRARDLRVVIRFRVSRTGVIQYVRIEQRSGNRIMDNSVEQLIHSLQHTLPAPPSPMEFTVALEMTP